MNAVSSLRSYIDRMITIAGPGMKILLLDSVTTPIISSVISQSEIMSKEVYLCDKLDNFGPGGREPLRHLKCLTLLCPTPENVSLLSRELAKGGLYGSYYCFWTGIIPKAEVKRLAENDSAELVREIIEFYCEFLPINQHTFICPSGPGAPGGPEPLRFSEILDDSLCTLIVKTLTSFCLANKKYPTLIRYAEWSKPCQKITDRLSALIWGKEKELFESYRGRGQGIGHTIVLLLDRRDDPVTPLLNQWTYQAMVHELLGIKNQRVSLANAPDVPKDCREVVLSPATDSFFANNLYADFGAVGFELRKLVEEYSARAKSHTKVESIDDMKTFLENYPQFKNMSGTVAKHFAIVNELARLTGKGRLLEVSELEQEIAAGVSHSSHSAVLGRIKEMIPKVGDFDALRLVLLYSLKYEGHTNNDINGLVGMLAAKGTPDSTDLDLGLPKNLQKYAGLKKRGKGSSTDLFGNLNSLDPVAMSKRFMKGLQGVENIFTQHTPWIKGPLEEALKGKLKETEYPSISCVAGGGIMPPEPPKEIIVFMIGGITYAEALVVYNLNRIENRTAIVLGGTAIHNTRSFLEQVKHSVQGSGGPSGAGTGGSGKSKFV